MLAIVAHTKRAEQAHHLMETVGAAYMTIDNGTLGAERNHTKAWTWLRDNATDDWCIVLEDDAVPVTGFRHQLSEALQQAPTPTVVSLYMGRKRPPHWQQHLKEATEKATNNPDVSWITGTHLLHAVGIAIKTDLVADMLTHTATTRYPWDYRVAAWALTRKHPIHYTWPSIVDHADQPTVTRHPDKMPRTPGRTAWMAAPRTTWTSTAIPLRTKT